MEKKHKITDEIWKEANLIPEEELRELKIKLGKSHRKESDWTLIKDILARHELITFRPGCRNERLSEAGGIACEEGALIAFTNLPDCQRHLQMLSEEGVINRFVEVGAIGFEAIVEMADVLEKNIIIDMTDKKNERCMMYDHEKKKILAGILA